MVSATFSTLILGLLAIANAAPSANALFGPAPVNLRSAANYAILAKSGVSTVSPSTITGNVGVSPVTATGLTGFSQTLDSTGSFSTSVQVVGKLFAASYTAPTPATLTTAIADFQTAFNDANARTNPGFTNFGGGAIGGATLTPGLYKWTTGVNANADFTLLGTALDTWIFQVGGTLSIAAGKKALLVGALNRNIVWVVAGDVTVLAGGHLEGVVLAGSSVALVTGASHNGHIFAQTAVAVQKSTVVS